MITILSFTSHQTHRHLTHLSHTLPLPYSSEDAPDIVEEELFVYYCKYSGRHVLTTNCNLSKAPRRRTDHSLVLDTEKYAAKLYTTDGGIKLIKRPNGDVEKQYRLNIGQLPVAYTSEPNGRYLYILDGALTTYRAEEGGTGLGGGKQPLPPCIIALPGKTTTQVTLFVEERSSYAAVLKISADYVEIQIKGGIQGSRGQEELLEMMGRVLGCRLGQMRILRGETAKHKILAIDGSSTSPEDVFEKLQKAVAFGKQEVAPASHSITRHVLHGV